MGQQALGSAGGTAAAHRLGQQPTGNLAGRVQQQKSAMQLWAACCACLLRLDDRAVRKVPAQAPLLDRVLRQ